MSVETITERFWARVNPAQRRRDAWRRLAVAHIGETA